MPNGPDVSFTNKFLAEDILSAKTSAKDTKLADVKAEAGSVRKHLEACKENVCRLEERVKLLGHLEGGHKMLDGWKGLGSESACRIINLHSG